MVLKNLSKFVSRHLTEWHHEKKYIRSNNMQFFKKELSNAYKKKRNFEIVILKKDLSK